MSTATTPAKLAANRENSKLSTGPRTEAGKAATAQNALKFGLFSTKNCVQPHERNEYNEVSAHLWNTLNPVGAIEELHATEIVRCAWRLRRCAHAESSLTEWNRQRESKRTELPSPDVPLHDPMLYNYTATIQASIDRARCQAQSAMRHALADLRALQTERHLRAEALPQEVDPAIYGLASLKEVLAGLGTESRAKLLASKVNTLERNNRIAEMQNQAKRGVAEVVGNSQAPATPRPSTPRNATCPCGSNQKHKRCCGRNAPPVLTMAA